jgi:serine protease AprX
MKKFTIHNSQFTIFWKAIFSLCIVHCALCIANVAVAQQKYWISFTDKNGTVFNPYEYFDQRTIEQRLLYHIPLSDSTDFPVSENYISQIKAVAEQTSYSSRWLNGVAAIVTDSQIELIKHFSFIKETQLIETRAVLCEATYQHFSQLEKEKQQLLKFQTHRMYGEKFRENKLDGTGIRIAIFDAGFPSANKHPALEHVFKNHRIVATYDFVKKKEDVYSHNSHGLATFSCIAGVLDSINIGLATGAEFLLARTEIASREPFSEEENWLAAVEWADKHGANIISSSLGYTVQRYFNTDMNGKKSLVAKAAAIAASKGILVVSAAGNEGDNSWRFLSTPADADNILTVGAVDPHTDYKADFSSFGPTTDGRLKPNVCAIGDAIVANQSGYDEEEGTSFAAPLVAGFAACVWQQHRDWNNMKLLNEIEKSAHLYPYFDYAHGYGIPQAGYFTDAKTEIQPTFYFVLVNDNLQVTLDDKYAFAGIEKFFGYKPIRNLYYRVDGGNGGVKFYSVVLAEQKEVLQFSTNQFAPGDKLTVHFEGYTNSYTIRGEENPPSPVQENK